MKWKFLVGLSAITLVLAACGPVDSNNGSGSDCSNGQLLTSSDVSGGVTLSAGCYLAEQSLTVSGGTLTLEPGVTIQFARDTQLTIAGRDGGVINSQGTEEDPVFLTGVEQEKGFWTGVWFDNSTDSSNSLDYTVIEYGGGNEFGNGLGQANLGVGGFVGESRVAVTNSTFRHSAGHGIEFENNDTFLDFAANVFEDNDDFAVSIPAHQRGMIDTETTFMGDGAEAGVEIHGSGVGSDQTWVPLKDQAYTSLNSSVGVSARLQIEPGVELHFGDNTSFTVKGRDGGALVSAGSADNPVLFTGAEQMPGAWRGVYIDNSEDSDNSLDHTTVEYAGSTEIGSGLGQSNLGVGGFVGASRISITNSTFRHSAGHGVEVESTSSFIDFSGNTFEANADYALSIPANQRRHVQADTDFVGDEAISYVEVFGGGVTEAGTWADLSGDAFTAITGGVSAASRLELAPGVEMHFGDNVGFTVAGRDNGVLVASGESDNEIVFTRLGTVQWKGIYFDNSESSENIIDNAVIEYGGFTEIEDQKANLFIGGFVGSTSLTVTNSEITNSDGAGIYIESSSADQVNQDIESVNTFANNAGGDVVWQ